MGWLAAGGATLLVGIASYKLVVGRSSASQSSSSGGRPESLKDNHARAETHTLPTFNLEEDVDRSPAFTIQAPAMPQTPLAQSQERTASGSTANHTRTPSIDPLPATAPQARSSSPPRLKPPTFGSMPAPPRPNNVAPLRPPPSASASLRVPQTKVLSNTSMAPSSLMPPPKPKSRQVTLRPGHSPLDWAVLTSNPNHRLRGKDVPDNLIRVSPSMLKYHNGRKGKDAWTAYQGKVYNITPYLPFHPGGEPELMKGAGRGSEKLFMEVHPWVNWDGMLAECLVGILVGEGEEKDQERSAGGLDEMD